MTINNLETAVPSGVRSLIMSEIPFGSEYVIYTRSQSNNVTVYECIYRPLLSSECMILTVTRVFNSYTLSRDSRSAEVITVSSPYYAYSNIRGCGVYESNPRSGDIVAIMALIIASVCVIKWVFGGVFSCSKRFVNSR